MKRQFALLMLCSILAGCGKQQVEGDVVAVVNGDEITSPELNAAMPQLPPGSDPKKVRDVVLDRLINERLMVQGAKADDLDKSQDYVLKSRAADNLILASMFVKSTTDSINKSQVGKVDQFIASNPSRFAQRVILSVDQIKVPRQAVTDAWLKDARTLDDIARILTAHKVGFDRGLATIDSVGLEPADFAKIAGVANGRPFAVTQNGLLVFTTTLSRQAAPLTGPDANRAASTLLQQKAQTEGVEKRVKALRDAAKIEYQPGYAAPGGKK